MDGEEEYEVERILDSRLFRNQLQYYVHWKGYGEGERTWEPHYNLTHAKQLVKQFHKERPEAPKRISAASFAELLPLFRAPNVETDFETLAAIYPDIIDYDWTAGKYPG